MTIRQIKNILKLFFIDNAEILAVIFNYKTFRNLFLFFLNLNFNLIKVKFGPMTSL